MSLERKSPLAALTDDILTEVEQQGQVKEASEAPKREFSTAVAKGLSKLASDLRVLATEEPTITYDDLARYMEKKASKVTNLYKNFGTKPGKYSSFDAMDRLKKLKERAG